MAAISSPIPPSSLPIPANLEEKEPGFLHDFFQRFSSIDGHTIRLHLLNTKTVKVLFSVTALVYGTTKIFLWDTLLVQSIYKIIKLLKAIFSFTTEETSLTFQGFFNDHRIRHNLLKMLTNSFKVASGAYDLIVTNEITRMAYVALGFGAPQPIPELEMIFRPVAVLKFATKASHLFLAVHKVWNLDPQAPSYAKRDAWIILGKASLDFGIETLRWGFYFAGITTGSNYAAMCTIAVLGLVSNSLGLVKHLTPVKENASSSTVEWIEIPKGATFVPVEGPTAE